MINVVAEPTPNPAAMKFIPGCPVMAEGTANFPGPESASGSPLAMRLFGIDGVRGVFLGADFVSVAKDAEADWTTVEPKVRREIAAHFEGGDPVIAVPDRPEGGAGGDGTDEVVMRILDLMETRIRPSVAMDGGDIVFRGFERGVVYLTLQGACAGCPRSAGTLKMGVENLLRHYVPDVIRVEAVP
jgi:Fe-S cluster biogenesis protein NfuA